MDIARLTSRITHRSRQPSLHGVGCRRLGASRATRNPQILLPCPASL
jgi:hypothetical protein